jgi:hypothetical protein
MSSGSGTVGDTAPPAAGLRVLPNGSSADWFALSMAMEPPTLAVKVKTPRMPLPPALSPSVLYPPERTSPLALMSSIVRLSSTKVLNDPADWPVSRSFAGSNRSSAPRVVHMVEGIQKLIRNLVAVPGVLLVGDVPAIEAPVPPVPESGARIHQRDTRLARISQGRSVMPVCPDIGVPRRTVLFLRTRRTPASNRGEGQDMHERHQGPGRPNGAKADPLGRERGSHGALGTPHSGASDGRSRGASDGRSRERGSSRRAERTLPGSDVQRIRHRRPFKRPHQIRDGDERG